MKIFRAADAPLQPANPQTFVGPAQASFLASDEAATPAHLYHVRFDDGARTNWHSHSGPQWLFVVTGRIRVQRWGAPAEELGAGDAIVFAPGEKHWHGAAPGGSGSHLAVNVDATTTWLEPVTDDDYRRV